MDIDKEMEEYELKREKEKQLFFNKCLSKMDDGKIAYHSFELLLCERFDIEIEKLLNSPEAIYLVLNHFVENVDEPFYDWVNKNDAPLIRRADELPKIFPEFKCITDKPDKIVELANRIYGLDLKISHEDWYHNYVYSFSFDFNSFTPINLDEIKELKTEIEVLKKHGHPLGDLEDKLKSYGLSDDELEVI